MMKERLEVKRNFPNLLALSVMALISVGCSLEASLEQLQGVVDELPSTANQRKEPDFITGEIVTTGNGVVVKGTFGEVSEKQVLSSGVVIEGVFYE